MRDIISQIAISKSICGNLKSRLKKRGIRSSLLREEGVLPKLDGPPVGRGREMCGFMIATSCVAVAPVKLLLRPFGA